jgi:hypothetical protein
LTKEEAAVDSETLIKVLWNSIMECKGRAMFSMISLRVAISITFDILVYK